MLRYLWRNRESPPFASKRWLVVWAKRLRTAQALLALLFRHWWLRAHGARLARCVVIEKCQLEGPLHRLCVGAESFIGRNVTLVLHDAISIGSRVVINGGVTVLTASHGIQDPKWRMYHRPIEIADYAWIATGAMLLPGVRIGRGAIVGAGAVVREDVADYAIVTGNPAMLAGPERCRDLDYNPVAFAAPIEAWLGRAGTGTVAGS